MGSDDDSTLITDSALIMEDSVDDGVTLVQDRDDATRTLVLDEIGPRGPSYREQLAPRALHNAPPPAASHGPADDHGLAGTLRYPPRVVTAQPAATDPDRRMLPFGEGPRVGSSPAMGAPARPPQSPPVSQAPQPRPAPAPTGPVVPPPAWQPPARVSAPPPAAGPEGVAGPPGTPTFVIRFLAVCGALTALGLAVLIYLEA